jgi:type IV fimbrial biogenesis protein FimT
MANWTLAERTEVAMHYKNCNGFTLPELLITLGIIAIVLSMAVPGVSSMIKDNRLATQLNRVVADIHLARSEAVKRDVRVILCRSAAPDAPTPVCGGTAKVWDTGYIIFADDGNYSNNVYNSGTDVLLRRGQPALPGVEMRTSTWWNNSLEFNPDGTTHEQNHTAIMSLCDDRDRQQGRQIQVMPNGIPKLFADNISTCTPP